MFKSSKKVPSKKRNTIISLALAGAIAITGAFAYLTATDTATNMFTVGNVVVELTEPNWSPDVDSDGDGINDTMSNIVAGQKIAKDPTLTNTGDNNAYGYIMVEIPKVYETDITGDDGVAVSQQHYPLFSFEANDNWELVDSQVGTEDDAYDYYLYAYKDALVPGNEVTLFDEVKFANITDNFVNTITGEAIVDLDIKVTGYAIQSDYYNGEATDAKSAWNLYATQNNWTWPANNYEGLVSVNYLNENNVLVNKDTVYAGTPVTMYFEPSLAKDGYTFDWVDEATGETAYSGMTVEENTTLTATYAETGYGEEAGNYFVYHVKQNDEYGVYAEVYGIAGPNKPTEPTTVIIPSHITFTLVSDVTQQNGGSSPSKYAAGAEATGLTLDDGGYQASIYATLSAGTHTIPVMVDTSGAYSLGPASVATKLIYPDTIREIKNGFSRPLEGLDVSPVEEIIFPYGITSIRCLSDLVNLKSLDLPNTLTSLSGFNIGGGYGPVELDTLVLPKSLKTCGRLNGLALNNLIINSDVEGLYLHTDVTVENVIFAEGVTKIPDSFASAVGTRCSTINNITFPSTLKTIGTGAFWNNTSLPQFELPSSVENFGKNAFSGCTSITGSINNIKSVGDSAFFNCTGITSITFDNSISTIGTSAFSGCTGLAEIVIPDSVTTIGQSAFSSCKNLTNVTISNNVTTIPIACFSNCSSLASITIPDNVAEIGNYAFNGTKLTSVSLPSGCTIGTTNVFPTTCKITYR